MSDESTIPANEESLREYVDVVFTLEEALAPAQERSLHDTLDKLPGVKSASLIQKAVTVHYDPTETAADKISDAVKGAGLRIADAIVTPSSPMTDALQGQHTEEPPSEEAR